MYAGSLMINCLEIEWNSWELFSKHKKMAWVSNMCIETYKRHGNQLIKNDKNKIFVLSIIYQSSIVGYIIKILFRIIVLRSYFDLLLIILLFICFLLAAVLTNCQFRTSVVSRLYRFNFSRKWIIIIQIDFSIWKFRGKSNYSLFPSDWFKLLKWSVVS